MRRRRAHGPARAPSGRLPDFGEIRQERADLTGPRTTETKKSMSPLPPGSRAAARTAGVAAVLGPTNTGKTHHAIERMLSFPTGLIGLPLRLLAREVYTRVVEKVGAGAVALMPRPR
jgi:hypothetical protein